MFSSGSTTIDKPKAAPKAAPAGSTSSSHLSTLCNGSLEAQLDPNLRIQSWRVRAGFVVDDRLPKLDKMDTEVSEDNADDDDSGESFGFRVEGLASEPSGSLWVYVWRCLRARGLDPVYGGREVCCRGKRQGFELRDT